METFQDVCMMKEGVTTLLLCGLHTWLNLWGIKQTPDTFSTENLQQAKTNNILSNPCLTFLLIFLNEILYVSSTYGGVERRGVQKRRFWEKLQILVLTNRTIQPYVNLTRAITQ